MTGTWESFGWRNREVPKAPLDDERRPGYGLPLTLRPVQDPRAVQKAVFDPALKQYPNAYRATDPRFADREVGLAWRDARRRAIDLVLAGIAGSDWADHLVLRGSVLLRGWYGEAAREPGDLDFVVTPADWEIGEPRTAAMIDGIARAAEQAAGQAAAGHPVRFDAAGAVSEDIWTYERVPGRRLALPWTAEGLPGGTVQLDFVFNERLPVAPERRLVRPLADGPGAPVLGVTPELSLAWKLMWLVTDRYPQGKDLYDAVLLAESCRLRRSVLRDAFVGGEHWYAFHPVTAARIGELAVDLEWDDFAREYPEAEGGPEQYVRRLAEALAPTFDGDDGTGPEAKRWWLAGWVDRYREVLDSAGMPEVQRRLATSDAPAALAIVITRELLGGERCRFEDACAVVLAEPAWSGLVDRYGRDPEWWAGLVREARDGA
ncbi:nucleotidyl transferase AbiEii/AbiGii toxin family protein [Kitasatospora sp. NPDC092286]|uniref:nucleotidyl transferase AbiEii/AbiGii toxin family protein n=1 Tax=Kitasatospora sp. NPDC092286 TaxID=3364087 RepID=UPI003828AC23